MKRRKKRPTGMTKQEIIDYFITKDTYELVDNEYVNTPCHQVIDKYFYFMGNQKKGVFYPGVTYNKKGITLARLICMERYGDTFMIDKDTIHLCHNTKCVNPDHIIKGTTKENFRTSALVNRLVHGENHPSNKLKDFEIRLIRAAVKDGIEQKKIARYFGVSQAVISEIKNKLIWKHIL